MDGQFNLSLHNTDMYATVASDIAYYDDNSSLSTIAGSIVNRRYGNSSLPGEARTIIRFSHNLLLWALPILFVGGIIGNTLTYCVLWSRDFQHSTLRWTVSALTTADALSLVFRLLPEWLFLLIGRHFLMTNTHVCKMYFFLWYFLPHVCSWMVVVVTVERTLSVCTPLRARALCGSRSLRITMATLVGLLALLNCPTLIQWGARVPKRPLYGGNQTSTNCLVDPAWDRFNEDTWYWMDVILLSLLPFVIILTCNAIIITKLREFKKMRQMMVTNGHEYNSSLVLSTVVMLVVASIVFLITTLPSTVYYLLDRHWKSAATPLNGTQHARLYLIAVVCNLLYYLNNGINFLLYCLSGSYFRRTLARMFSRHLRKKSTHHYHRPISLGPTTRTTRTF